MPRHRAGHRAACGPGYLRHPAVEHVRIDIRSSGPERMRLPHGRTTWTFSTRTRLSTQPWTSVWNVGRTQWFCTNLAVAPSKLAVPGWWLYFEGAETHHGSMPQALSRGLRHRAECGLHRADCALPMGSSTLRRRSTGRLTVSLRDALPVP
jgi:hypothetical protein